MSATLVTSATNLSDDGGTGSSVSPSVPSGLAEGDLWVILLVLDAGDTVTLNAPTGFTAATNVISPPSSQWPALRAYYKVAGAGESAPTISYGSSSGYARYYASCRVSGANTSTPLDGAASTNSASGGTSADVTDLSVAADGSLAFGFASVQGSETVGIPSGSTLLIENTSWTGGSIVYQAVDAGTFNPGAWSHSGNAWAAGWFVIAPAAGAAPASFIAQRSPILHMLIR